MKPYFNFNRKEKLGVVILSGIILLLTVFLNVGYSTYVPDPFDVDESKLSFLSLTEDDDFEKYRDSESEVENQFDKTTYKPVITNFDPNKIGVEKWESFGFSQKQAQSIVKYRTNYGPFTKKEDIHKLYVVSDEKYADLEPYILIQEIKNEKPTTEWVDQASLEPDHIIDLNAANKDELISLSGIGDYYADRILNYRKKLGGFIDFEQIEEMTISDEAKAILIETSTIDRSKIQKRNINTATKDELRDTPYSNWLTVATIIKEREKGVINSLKFLTSKEISEEDKEKFAYYITF